MSRLTEQLAVMPFPDIQLADDEVLTDVVVAARVTRMSDGRQSVVVGGSEGIDIVTRVGLLECARQITAEGGWADAEEER